MRVPMKWELSNDMFDKYLERRLDEIKRVLGVKAKEYVRNSDRLHNFNVGAIINGTSPFNALAGMLLKHEVSIKDIIQDAHNCKEISVAMIEEKLGDGINYLILLEAMLKNQVDKGDGICIYDYDLEEELDD